MFSRKEKKPLPDFSDVYVKLKPLLGIQPGVYLTILYSIVLLVIIFMVLFFPGLKAYGTYMHFHSVPDRASVWVDGEYKGSTPCVAFIRKGTHQIELRKTYFKTVSMQKIVRGRLVGTLFAPLREQFRASIEIQDLNGYLEWIFKEWADWGMLNRFATNYPLPKLLSEASLIAWTSPAEKRRMIQDLLTTLLSRAAYFVDSPEEMKELIRAAIFTEAAGGILDSTSLQRIIRRAKSFLARHRTFPYWILLSLPSRRSVASTETGVLTAEQLARSEAFKAFHAQYLQYLHSFSAGRDTRNPGRRLVLSDIPFREIPAGSAVFGKDPQAIVDRVDHNLPYPTILQAFYMAETELTNEQYREFLLENPDWSKNSIEALVNRGDVSRDYLADWQGDSFPTGTARHPVTGVSHTAAKAYCKWLTSKLPDSLAEYEVRLPYDEEWEWAAREGEIETSPKETETKGNGKPVFGRDDGPEAVDQAQPNALGLRNMLGNVWEWCEDWYLPAGNLLAEGLPVMVARASTGVLAYGGSEKIVRGGSWANAEQDIRIYTKGSQPADWCTPYLGFRVVVDRK